ncbi:hypothetical protein ACFQZE_23680 [Paenibacillus sp. GCM10027627]
MLTDNDSWSATGTIEQLLRCVGRDPEGQMADNATFNCSSLTGNDSWSAAGTIEQLLRCIGRIRKS